MVRSFPLFASGDPSRTVRRMLRPFRASMDRWARHGILVGDEPPRGDDGCGRRATHRLHELKKGLVRRFPLIRPSASPQLISSKRGGSPGLVGGARWMPGGTGQPGYVVAMRQRWPMP